MELVATVALQPGMEVAEDATDYKGNLLVKKDTVTNLLDRLYAALPDEVKEARALLRRKDELQYEAQQKAEKISKQT